MFGHVVAHPVFRLAGGEHVDNCGARVRVGLHDGLVEMIDVSASRLRDIHILVHHADVAELFPVLFLSMDHRSVETHLGVLPLEGASGRLPASVRVDLRV